MRTLPRLQIAGFAFYVAATLALMDMMAGTAHAAGSVKVNFIEPETYQDAGQGARQIERTTQAIGAYLQGLGPQLPEGQTLTIEVTDIDLAGEVRPRRLGPDLRVLRGRADWPRINLRWTLVQDGRAVKSAEDHVADMNYLGNTLGLQRHQEFAFEQRMLGRWFSDNFAAADKAP